MNKELTEIERLDLAARAESVETALSRAVLPMVFVTVITLLLALGSQASPSETLAVWTFALIGVVTVIMLLLHWCYAAYGVSILNFLAAIEILKYSNDRYSHTFLGSTTNQFFLVWFLLNGYGWWKAAAPFAAAHDDSFDKERDKIGQWLATWSTVTGMAMLLSFQQKASGMGTGHIDSWTWGTAGQLRSSSFAISGA